MSPHTYIHTYIVIVGHTQYVHAHPPPLTKTHLLGLLGEGPCLLQLGSSALVFCQQLTLTLASTAQLLGVAEYV